jgi:hypothetical protein
MPPAQWSPQPPPYAAPPGWQPPPPPPYAGGAAGYAPPAPAGTWQPAGPDTWQPAAGPSGPTGWPPPRPDQGGQPPYGWAPAYPGNAGTNGFAIAAFVLAIPPVCMFTVGVGSLLGVIFGIIGLRQTRRDGSRGRGMAITGIVLGALGLVVAGLVVIGLAAAHSNNSTGSGNGSSDTISTLQHLPAASSGLDRRT